MKIAPWKTEQRVLVAALQNESRSPVRNHILSNTQEDDFGTEEAAEIRKRMSFLVRNGRDIGDVASFLEDPTLSETAQEFLNVSTKYRRKAATVGLDKIKQFVSILHDHRKARALFQSAQKVTELCTGQFKDTTLRDAEIALLDGVKAIREDRTKSLTHVGRGRSLAEIRAWLKQKRKREKNQFVSTGLTALDRHIRGFQRGDLVVVSAPRGGGKTALLLQMAISQFQAGYNVGIASLEMNADHLFDRVIANVCDIDFWRVRLREFDKDSSTIHMWRRWKRFEYNTAKKYGNIFTPWDIKDPNYMPENIELDLGPFGYDVIFVDYISLFGSSKRQDMWATQKEHSRYLKQLAGRLNPKCVLVVLTQLSKEERVKYGTGPEEDADYWIWWRYGDDEEKTGKVEIQLAKARHAKRGIIQAQFDLARMRITTQGTLKTGMSSYVENEKKRKGDKDVDWDQFDEMDADLDSVRDAAPDDSPAWDRRSAAAKRPEGKRAVPKRAPRKAKTTKKAKGKPKKQTPRQKKMDLVAAANAEVESWDTLQ